MPFWSGKKVLVTGGAGFIGSHLAELLVDHGAQVSVLVHHARPSLKNLERIQDRVKILSGDLLSFDDALRVTTGQEVVMNLAANVGGIDYNVKNPASIFRENALLFLNVIEASRRNDVERFLVTSSACVYPRFCTIPTPESEGFKDMPEPTSEGYGFSKRMQEFLAQKYAQQYGMKIAIARPYNAYGPRDNFHEGTSHVIPSLIKRVMDAQEGDKIEVWGDGTQSRAFLYVEDFARGLLAITEKYPVADVLNIGSDEEITIGNLVKLIIELCEKKMGVHFDTSKPTGQPRRNCDTTKAKEKIQYYALTPLRLGLQQTIAWYRDQMASKKS